MAKRFRLRISRVIPSFQSCRSKDDTAALPARPVNPKALDIDFPLTPSPLQPPPPPRKLHSHPFRTHVPVVSSSAVCGRRSSSRSSNCRTRHPSADAEADDLSLASETPAYLWRKEEKWHVVARLEPSPRRKIDSDDGELELFPPLSIQRRRRKITMTKKKRISKSSIWRARVSNSSADAHWFSSEEEEYEEDYDYDCNVEEDDNDDDEIEMLISSSRSFSADYSSDFTPQLESIRESVSTAAAAAARPPPHHRRSCAYVGGGRGKAACPSPETASPAASAWGSSVLRRLMTLPCGAVEGKVRESFAVVKRSEDPYGDFRRSMVEMVVEKQMYEERDLEQLLHCFLSLNSRHHHPTIVQVFSEIWDALFPSSAASNNDDNTAAAPAPPPPLPPPPPPLFS